jgi:hypothetical protein
MCDHEAVKGHVCKTTVARAAADSKMDRTVKYRLLLAKGCELHVVNNAQNYIHRLILLAMVL